MRIFFLCIPIILITGCPPKVGYPGNVKSWNGYELNEVVIFKRDVFHTWSGKIIQFKRNGVLLKYKEADGDSVVKYKSYNQLEKVNPK